MRYILRSALPLKRLTYVERTGQVHYQEPHGPGKSWPHAVDFLAYVTTVLCDACVRSQKQPFLTFILGSLTGV